MFDGEALIGLPYAAQRLGHASPNLRPVRALLIRVSLGPHPSLHRLRHRITGFVRRLHSYYGGVALIELTVESVYRLRVDCGGGECASPSLCDY